MNSNTNDHSLPPTVSSSPINRKFRALIALMGMIFAISIFIPLYLRSKVQETARANNLLSKLDEETREVFEQESETLGVFSSSNMRSSVSPWQGEFSLETFGVRFHDNDTPAQENVMVVRIIVNTSAFDFPLTRITYTEGLLSEKAVKYLSDALSREDVGFDVMRVSESEWTKLQKPASSPRASQVVAIVRWSNFAASFVRKYLLLVAGLFFLIQGLSTRAIPDTILCKHCRYNLRGSTGGHCSECGEDITPQSLILMTTQRRPALAVFGVVLIVLGFLLRDVLEPMLAMPF